MHILKVDYVSFPKKAKCYLLANINTINVKIKTKPQKR